MDDIVREICRVPTSEYSERNAPGARRCKARQTRGALPYLGLRTSARIQPGDTIRTRAQPAVPQHPMARHGIARRMRNCAIYWPMMDSSSPRVAGSIMYLRYSGLMR